MNSLSPSDENSMSDIPEASSFNGKDQFKEIVNELRASEEKFCALAENALVGIFSTDLNGQMLYANNALAVMMGFTSSQEMMSQNILQQCKNSTDIERLIETLQREGRVRNFPLELCTISGDTIHILLSAVLSSGILNGMFVDITEQLRVNDILLEKDRKYRILFENSMDAIFMTTKEGMFFDVNNAALHIFGYSRSELMNMNVVSLYEDPADWARFQGVIETNGSISDYEVCFRRKDGKKMDCLLTSALHHAGDGTVMGYHAIIRDITELKRTQEELAKIAKLESVGMLAGGIAHDFNNILTAILGNANLVMMYIGEDAIIRDKIREIESAALRAKDLTHQLLTFSKGGTPVKTAVSIPDLVRNTAGFSLMGSNVSCRFEFADNLWSAEVDEGQMSQVINNIVINADQSMPDGGIITVRGDNYQAGNSDLPFLKKGKYVKIIISDSGAGISPEIIQNIFDPYFSTKNEGSGLGLAIVYSILRKHEGGISVESEVGIGTSFSIYVPASSEKNAPPRVYEDKIVSGNGRVLIVDDERAVRDIAVVMLSQMGYEVAVAKDGDEALEIYRQRMKSELPFDLVIMDLTIPGGMGGRECLSQLLLIDPRVKAIVSSGYHHDPVMANFRSYGFLDVIPKPFDIYSLGRVVKRVITSGS